MIGFLYYLISTALVHHALAILAGILAFLKIYKTKLDRRFTQILVIILFITIASTLNLYYHLLFDNVSSLSKSSINFIPYSLFIFISIFIAQALKEKDLKIVLNLIIFEIGIGIIEYSLSTPSILPWVSLEGETSFGFKGLLYYSRTYGLSTNSSVFAYKILIGFLLFHLLPIKGKVRIFYYSMLIIGVLVTFNRTCILSLIFFYCLYFSKDFFISVVNSRLKTIHIYIFISSVTIILILAYNAEFVYYQLNRGMETKDSSHRFTVWSYYWTFIKENLFFGNGSVKKWFSLHGRIFHAHNVFLQTLATNGLIITILYVYLIFSNIRWNNYVWILPILLTGLTQYTYLWGVSFMDIFLYYLLLKPLSKYNESIPVKHKFLLSKDSL